MEHLIGTHARSPYDVTNQRRSSRRCKHSRRFKHSAAQEIVARRRSAGRSVTHRGLSGAVQTPFAPVTTQSFWFAIAAERTESAIAPFEQSAFEQSAV